MLARAELTAFQKTIFNWLVCLMEECDEDKLEEWWWMTFTNGPLCSSPSTSREMKETVHFGTQ